MLSADVEHHGKEKGNKGTDDKNQETDPGVC